MTQDELLNDLKTIKNEANEMFKDRLSIEFVAGYLAGSLQRIIDLLEKVKLNG